MTTQRFANIVLKKGLAEDHPPPCENKDPATRQSLEKSSRIRWQPKSPSSIVLQKRFAVGLVAICRAQSRTGETNRAVHCSATGLHFFSTMLSAFLTAIAHPKWWPSATHFSNTIKAGLYVTCCHLCLVFLSERYIVSGCFVSHIERWPLVTLFEYNAGGASCCHLCLLFWSRPCIVIGYLFSLVEGWPSATLVFNAIIAGLCRHLCLV